MKIIFYTLSLVLFFHFTPAFAGAGLACENCKASNHKNEVSALKGVAVAGLEQGCRRIQSGVASWYGPGFQGRKTANGERFDTNKLTAAHKTLPIRGGFHVKVVNKRNGKSVVVRINDRGPYVHGRIIDLSRRGFKAIADGGAGTVPVELQVCSNHGRAYASNDD